MDTKINSGFLFKNNKKTKDSQPDYTGKANIEGLEKDIAAWVRQSKSGEQYMSITFKVPWKKEENKRPRIQNEDMPF